MILVMNIFLTSCMLMATECLFPFFEKAKFHYRNQTGTGGMQNKNANIDSLLKLHTNSLDFNAAYDISRRIGRFFLEQGKYATALDIYNNMRHEFESKANKTVEDKKKISSVLNVIGAIYEETGLWNIALGMYMNSLKVCDEIGYNQGKAKIYNNIGKVYYNRHELNKAEDLFNKAVAINKMLNIRPELFNNYNNIAGVYQQKGDTKKALEYLLVALNQLDLNRDYYDLSIAYDNIGTLYQQMGNNSLALSYFFQAADLQEEKSFLVSLLRTDLSISTLFEETKKMDSSLIYLNRSLKLVDSIGNPSQRLIVLRNAAQFYRRTGNNERASDLFSTFISLNDSMENLNSLTKIEQIQDVYEVINNEKDNKILQQKINLQQLSIQRQRVVLFASTILLLFLGYFLFNLQRNRKRERDQNEFIAKQTELFHQKEKEMMLSKEHNLEMELEYKKKELTLNVMSFMKVNEMLSEIYEKIIQSAKSAQHQETKDFLKKIGKEVQKSTDTESMKEFSLRFKEVNKDFFDKLLAKYPELSSSELKLCAFLKLNMSTKEICELTGQQQKAIETARYRLRQKLGIANSDVKLITFINQI